MAVESIGVGWNAEAGLISQDRGPAQAHTATLGRIGGTQLEPELVALENEGIRASVDDFSGRTTRERQADRDEARPQDAPVGGRCMVLAGTV